MANGTNLYVFTPKGLYPTKPGDIPLPLCATCGTEVEMMRCENSLDRNNERIMKYDAYCHGEHQVSVLRTHHILRATTVILGPCFLPVPHDYNAARNTR